MVATTHEIVELVFEQEFYVDEEGKQLPHGVTKRYYAGGKIMVEGEFQELAEYAREIGFKGVMSSPLTRSSYRAETLYADALNEPTRS